MRVIKPKTLQDYYQAHPDVEQQLKAWLIEAEHADWKTFNDIKQRFRSADVLSENRVVFNIKGNHYRLVVKINYRAHIVLIRFIGTHAEYNRIDSTNK